MSHYAHIDSNNTVTEVIVAEQDFIDSLEDSAEWIQTSYNTVGGIHLGHDRMPDNGTPLRKNYAGAGYTYDKERDAFIPPTPYPSWLLEETTCTWNSPIPLPDDGRYYQWDESTTNWMSIPRPNLEH